MATYQNSFEKGCQIGVHPWVQQAGTASVLENARLLSKENTAMVVQAMPSTTLLESLPEGSLAYASANYNGIAYLVLHYPVTGVSEIGSYPSPNHAGGPVTVGGRVYAANEMVPKYSAFQNLRKSGEKTYGPFSTAKLALSQDNDISMVIQPDYDGTVNVIFTDGKNPIRLVNSRFSVLPDNLFEIIDRQGENDTNLYSEDTLGVSVKLILESSSVVKAELESVRDGGSLKAGNYRYYFSYENADGNTTDTIAESGLVSVFFGDTIGSVHGGRENQNANRQVRLKLSGLDPGYTRLRMHFAYASGDITAQTTLYRMANAVPFSKGELVLTHTGNEPLQVADISAVQRTFASIDTVKSLTQIGSYLVGANVREKKTDISSLAAFAARVFAGTEYTSMYCVESTVASSDMKELYTEKIDQSSLVFDGFLTGGYANPRNIHDRLGYHDAESYAIGIVYILTDGSLSQVFPVVGIDNLDFKYTVGPKGYYMLYTANPDAAFFPGMAPVQGVQQVSEINGGFNASNDGLNTLGIVRFPRRNAPNVPALLDQPSISINKLVANIPVEKPAGTVGCFFVRAPRVPDRIAQGYLLPTFKLLRNEPAFYSHDGYAGNVMTADSWNQQQGNYKVLPICLGLLDMVKGSFGPYFRSLRLRKQRISQGENASTGNGPLVAGRIQLIDRSRIAFICPDSFGNPTDLSQVLNDRKVFLDVFGKAYSLTAAPQLTGIADTRFTAQTIPCIIQTRIINGLSVFGGQAVATEGTAHYMPKNTNATNNGGFSSRSEGFLGFQTRQSFQFNSAFLHFAASYEDYFGISISNGPLSNTVLGELMANLWPVPQATPAFGGDFFSADAGNVAGQYGDSAYVANIYPSGGVQETLGLKNTYGNTEALAYAPISQRMLWAEVEASLNGRRNIDLYGGDCYTNISFRRLYHTNLNPAAKGTETQEQWFGVNEVSAKAGQVITLCTQNNTNTYLRGVEPALSDGKKQVSLPRMDGTQTDIREWRQPIYMKPEPSVYNRGYTGIPSGRRYQAFPLSAPYIANHWFNRVIYLGPHVLSNFANAYRQWGGTGYQDYETQYGQIMAVKTVAGNLACIWENACGFIPFQERTYGGESETGLVFVEQKTVLGPRAQIVSGLYGSRHPASLVATDNALFGADARNKKIWMLTPQGLNHFSDYSVHPLLEKFSGGYASRKVRQGAENITGGFNSFFSEVWMTYLSKSDPQASFTLVFNEKYASQGLVQFSGRVGIMPYHYLAFGDGMLSLSALRDSHVMWQHDRYGSGFLRLHGIPVDFRLGFVVNGDPGQAKTYRHLLVNSNNVLPVRVDYAADGVSAFQEVLPYDGQNIIDANARYLNGSAQIPIADTGMVTNDPIRAYLRQSLGNYNAETQEQSNMQGRALEIVLTYRGNKPIEILSVETETQPSL